MASEQAKALAKQIFEEVGNAGPWALANEDAFVKVADLIDAAFMPPCPDCWADWKPRAQWKCGSWNEPPARQIAVKCVQRQLAEANAKLASRDCRPVDPHDGAAVAGLADGLPDSGQREPPDAMR